MLRMQKISLALLLKYDVPVFYWGIIHKVNVILLSEKKNIRCHFTN